MKAMRGLATGIGSLPYKDADPALDLIFKYLPDIPFWPQLPKRDVREGMVAQFSENLPCIKVAREGIFFDGSDQEKELEGFYERIINKDVDHFKISPDFAQGLYAFKQRLSKINLDSIRQIKCHVVGPFTFAASLNDENGRAILHDPALMQAMTEGLLMKALWQIKFLEEFGKNIIVFIDEPYLGCFGSAFTPLNRIDVVNVLGEFTKRIKSAGKIHTGVHCCGNTDWSIFTDIPALDIINFDAFNYLDKLLLYADNLAGFFESDRIFCWGIVPTQEFDDKIKPDTLVDKINAGIDVLAAKGVNRNKISENLLLSPACGLGTLDADRAEKILKLLREVSLAIRKTS
jgi:methionine synthase II (cobalamin-independent)